MVLSTLYQTNILDCISILLIHCKVDMSVILQSSTVISQLANGRRKLVFKYLNAILKIIQWRVVLELEQKQYLFKTYLIIRPFIPRNGLFMASWFRPNQSLLLYIKVECLVEKKQLTVLVYCLTRSGIKLMILRHRTDHTNYYTSETVLLLQCGPYNHTTEVNIIT